MTTLTVSTKAQELLDELNAHIGEDLFEHITGDYWQRDLTAALCYSDTYDAILLIDGDYYFLTDVGTYFEISFITCQEPVYRWHESLLGDVELTDEQKEDFTEELKSELTGFTVTYEDRLTLNDWEDTFQDKLDDVLDSCCKALEI
jgi:hypothetical protein